MKILNFGSCNIDYVYTVPHIATAGETLAAVKMEQFSGGKGLNQSIAAARAGATIFHAGAIGVEGGFLRALLAESGVDVRYLKELPMKNGHAVIQVDEQGENSIVIFGGANLAITKEHIDTVLRDFSAGDILLLQNEISNVAYLIEKGWEKGMQVVFNPAPFDDALRAIDLHRISYLILNETEAKGFCGSEEAEEILSYMEEHYPALQVVLTLGRQGCMYSHGAKRRRQSAFAVEAVDTTGAGDTFIGYFVSLLGEGVDMDEILRIASAASALAVSREGAATSVPTITEVWAALRELRPYERQAASVLEWRREQILRYIDGHLSAAALAELADTLGYTAAYTGALVKKTTGESFSALLGRKRCAFAAVLLRETTLPISEIVRKIGYENESFFRRKFKEYYGVTPLSYRKKEEKEK